MNYVFDSIFYLNENKCKVLELNSKKEAEINFMIK